MKHDQPASGATRVWYRYVAPPGGPGIVTMAQEIIAFGVAFAVPLAVSIAAEQFLLADRWCSVSKGSRMRSHLEEGAKPVDGAAGMLSIEGRTGHAAAYRVRYLLRRDFWRGGAPFGLAEVAAGEDGLAKKAAGSTSRATATRAKTATVGFSSPRSMPPT
jgi:hypothetical protein